MISKTYSLRDAINTLKEHREKLKGEIGKQKIDRLLFNLEEISLDLENISEQIKATDAWERAGFDFNHIAGYFRLLAKPAPTLFVSFSN